MNIGNSTCGLAFPSTSCVRASSPQDDYDDGAAIQQQVQARATGYAMKKAQDVDAQSVDKLLSSVDHTVALSDAGENSPEYARWSGIDTYA